jgi:hypothetical protein
MKKLVARWVAVVAGWFAAGPEMSGGAAYAACKGAWV